MPVATPVKEGHDRRAMIFGALLVPLVFLAPGEERQIVFAPREGSRVEKQFELAVELRATRVEVDAQVYETEDEAQRRLGAAD